MPDFKVLNADEFADKSWAIPSDLAFASRDTYCPLVAPEMAYAATALPMAFLKHENSIRPVAILGLEPDNNQILASDGRWLGNYLPLLYRAYPFATATTRDGKSVLCFNQDSGLLREDSEGHAFYDSSGELATEVHRRLGLLKIVANNQQLTLQNCNQLDEFDLLSQIAISGDESKYKAVKGLYGINQKKLSELDGEKLQILSRTQALLMAYSQLISLRHLATLKQWLGNEAARQQKQDESPELNFDLSNEGTTLNFDNL